MTLGNQGNQREQAVPVYVVPSGNQGNVNYGFYPPPNHPPQGLPPKYEDVINGSTRVEEGRQPQPVAASDQGVGIFFVTPVYQQTKAQRAIGLIFLVVFMIVFISILIKILGSMN